VIFNIISNLDENFKIEKFNAYNHTIAYSLRKELRIQGHKVNLVRDHSNDAPPPCTHTIVVSNVAINKFLKSLDYRMLHRNATTDKICLWIDSDFADWRGLFDPVFCAARCTHRYPEMYVKVGWAADPEFFYPAQTTKTVFVDSFMWGWYNGKYDYVYESIKNVLADLELSVIQLVPEYNKVRRATWQEMIQAFRKSSFHVCTQIGGWGWTNIEAATCGALLVCHAALHRPETFPSPLNLKVWSTEQELRDILNGEVDVLANRKLALENTWRKIVKKVLGAVQ